MVAAPEAYWPGLVYYRGRVAPLRVRSWRGAFTTPLFIKFNYPVLNEFAAGSGFECRNHGATGPGSLRTGITPRSLLKAGLD
jgi:hypothetical protein